MNIVFVSGEFPKKPDAATGGIGTYLLTLTQELIRQGHQVTVITRNVETKYYPKIRIINCCSYTRFALFINNNRVTRARVSQTEISMFEPPAGGEFEMRFGKRERQDPITNNAKFIIFLIFNNIIKIFDRLINFINYPLLFSIQVIWKLKQLKNVDIIEGNDFGADLFFYLLLVKKRPPVVLRLHTPSFVIQKYNDEPETLFYKVVGFMEKFCLKKADSLYSPTKSLAGIISGIISRKISNIVPYPFKQIKLNKSVKKENLILYVGKLQTKKGVFTLLDAAKAVLQKYPQINFTFIGQDTLNQEMSIKDQLIKESIRFKIAKKVSILDPVNKASLYSLYSKAKIVVVPSFWENFPNVVLEAWNFNALVIAAKSGGLVEMIDSNINGLLFNPDNHLELAEKITEIYKNVLLQKKLIKNIPAKLKRYNHQEITRKTVIYYRTVISKT